MIPPELKWTKLENHPVTVIELKGEIDSPKKIETIEEIATGEGTQHVALLMENSTYINSTGCGQLVSLHRTIEDRGFSFYIVKASPAVTSVIKCLGIDALLHIKGDLDEVIREVEAKTQ
jgi:anti-anti-sigma factor